MADQHAVITGASAGIGRATAERFTAGGFVVHNLARREAPLSGVVNHFVDLDDTAALEQTCEKLREVLQGATRICLVNNAAVLFEDSLHSLDTRDFEKTLRVNVLAPAILAARLLRVLCPGSSIIFVGSTLSEKSVAGRLSYATSKHALVGLMRGVCQDLFGKGVHVACVCPGFVDTAMAKPNPRILDMISFGRLIRPTEIADFIYYVAHAPILNGAVLHANLGQREI